MSVLGPFALERDGVPVDTSRWQRRVATLFKLLATSPGHRRSRDEMVDILWPDAPPETGGGNLRLLVHRLRLTLGGDPSPVLSEQGWISLNPAYSWEVDLQRFETLARAGGDVVTLEEAASLYRGAALPEDRYDDWAARVREHVQRVWRDLCLRLAQAQRDRGAHGEAARWLERAVELDPVDEEAVRALMMVLAEAGRRADALRRFLELEAQLKEELDVPPSAETLALVDRIRTQLDMAQAKELDERFATVQATAAGPEALSPDAGGTRQAPSVGPAAAPARSRRSRRVSWPVTAAGTALGAAVLALALFLGRGTGSPPPATPTTRPLAFTLNQSGGSGLGQFHGPTGMSIDGAGRVYVADYGNNRIQVFSPRGVPLAQFGTLGSGPGQLKDPTDIALGPAGAIFVVDYGNNRIQKVLPDGTVLDTIQHGSRPAGGAWQPDTFTSAAVDRRGHIYATDLYNNRVVEFLGDSDNTVLATWGRQGSGPGEFRTPTGIAVDGNGNVYVVDTYNNRIEKFSPDGRFLAAWGRFGAGRGQFHSPEGMAVDTGGNIYVVDTKNQRIVKLSPAGRVLATWGKPGTGPGEFNQPSGVGVDRWGNIYATDFYNNRVEKLSPRGKPLWSTGGARPVRYH